MRVEARGAGLGQLDEWLVAQLPRWEPRQLLTAAGRDREHEAVLDDRDVREGPVDGKAHETDIEGAALERIELRRRGHVFEGDVHLRVSLSEGRHQPWDDQARRDAEAEAQLAYVATGRPTGAIEHPVGVADQGCDVVGEQATDAGELRATATADEERRTHLLLQLVNLLGERRLGEMQGPGSPSEVALLGKCLE